MTSYETLLKHSKKWEHLGLKTFENGARFVGPPSSPKKYDYLYCIKSSLSDEEIVELENRLHVPIHQDLKEFYLCANGFSCFSDWFSLGGLRRIHRNGTIEELMDQPFDLLSLNEFEPFPEQKNFLGISGYSDGSRIYMDLQGRCLAYSPKEELTFEWENFYEWVSQELARFESYIDENAKCEIGFADIPPPQRSKLN